MNTIPIHPFTRRLRQRRPRLQLLALSPAYTRIRTHFKDLAPRIILFCCFARLHLHITTHCPANLPRSQQTDSRSFHLHLDATDSPDYFQITSCRGFDAVTGARQPPQCPRKFVLGNQLPQATCGSRTRFNGFGFICLIEAIYRVVEDIEPRIDYQRCCNSVLDYASVTDHSTSTAPSSRQVRGSRSRRGRWMVRSQKNRTIVIRTASLFVSLSMSYSIY